MVIIRKFLLCIFTLWAFPALLRAQLFTTAASSPCGCDGSVTYTTALGGSVFYQLSEAGGAPVLSAFNSIGTVTFTGLCPKGYVLSITGNGTHEEVVFNISGGLINPGDAVTASMCSSAGTIQLFTLLNNYIPGGVWMNPAGQIVSGSLAMGNAQGGFYTYTLTSGGCEVSTAVQLQVIQNANPGLSTTYLICDTYMPFSMTSVLAGNADPGGHWFTSGNMPIGGIYDPATMSSALFIYKIDSVPGCGPVYSTLFVVENQTPNPGINTEITVCHSASPFSLISQLNGSPEPNGSWFDSSNAMIGDLFDPATQPSGVYRYHLEGSTPCVGQDAYLTITVVSENPSGADHQIVLCSTAPPLDMISQLNGTPLPGGIWSDAQGQVIGNVFDPATQPSGVYQYFYPNVSCFPTGSHLTISVETPPDAGQDQLFSLCENAGTVDLLQTLNPGISTAGSWSLNGQVISSMVPISTTGDYFYTYSLGAVICPSDEATLHMQVVGMPVSPSPQSATFCADNDTVSLMNYYSGISSLLTFTDPNGQVISPQFDPGSQTPGVYTVTVDSGNACPPVSGIFTIAIEQPIAEDQTLTDNVCETTGAIDLNQYFSNIQPSDGQWEDQAGNLSSGTVVLPLPDTYHYFFQTYPGVACGSYTLEIIIEVKKIPYAGENTIHQFCIQSPAIAMTSLMPNGADVDGSWWFNGQIFDATEFHPAADEPGNYSYVVGDGLICPADTAIVNIYIEPEIIYDAGLDSAICSGATSFTIGNTLTGNYSYQWSPGILLNDVHASEPSFSPINYNTTPDIHTYTVTVSNGICSTSDSIHITVYPLPALNLPTLLEWCEGENQFFSITGSETYLWQPSAYFSNPQAADPGFNENVPGDYNVVLTGTNSWGCSSSDTSKITIHPLPKIEISTPPLEGCTPLDVHIDLSENSQHVASAQWEVGNLSASGWTFNGVLTASQDYTLWVHALSEFGCAATASFPQHIHVFPNPLPAFIFDPLHPTTLENIVSVSNQSIGAESYQWTLNGADIGSDDDPVLTLSSDMAATYQLCLEAFSDHGCKSTTCKVIQLDVEESFFAPNSFTPNGDGINDVFCPVITGYDTSDYYMVIYDRWGNLVFSSNNADEAWMGNMPGGGHYVQEDVYVWQATIKERGTSDKKNFRGHVSVIR